MTLYNNFSEIGLLANELVTYYDTETLEEVFTIRIPTFKELYFGNTYTLLINLIKEYNEKGDDPLVKIRDIYGAAVRSSKGKIAKKMIERAFNNIAPKLEFYAGNYRVDKVDLPETVFFEILDILAIGIGLTEFKDFAQYEDPRERERAEKIKRIKRNGIKRSRDGGDPGSEVGFVEVFIAINREFDIPIEKQKEFNVWTLYKYFGYCQKLHAYRVNTVAAGNGLLKEKNSHKYFIMR